MKKPLTSREKEIRDYLLLRHYKKTDDIAKTESIGEYERGALAEVTEVLGKVLDILGG